MLIGILATAVSMALAVAYWFLVRHRRHGPIDEVPNNTSLYKQKRRGSAEARRSSRRPSALMAEGLLPPREARGTREEPLNFNPARDRSSGRMLTVPDTQAGSSQVPDNADFAAGARASTGGSGDSASGTAAEYRHRSSHRQSTPSRSSAVTMNVPQNVQVMSIGTDSSNSLTPPPTPPRSPRSQATAAASVAAADSTTRRGRPERREATGQSASELEHSESAYEGAAAGTAPSNAGDAAADAASKRTSYAAERKHRRSMHKDPREIDSRSEESQFSTATTSERSAYAAERRSRRASARAEEAAGPGTESSGSASRRSQSDYVQSRQLRRSMSQPEGITGDMSSPKPQANQSRRSVGFDDSVAAAASAAASDATSGRSRSSGSAQRRRSTNSARKSAGRIMAMQNAKAQKQDDDEETMV